MSPHEIRAALSRPPVFGDVEQIQALKTLRTIEEEHEGKNEYRVKIEWSGSDTVTVWADDEAQARELALEQVDLGDLDDVDYTVAQISL